MIFTPDKLASQNLVTPPWSSMSNTSGPTVRNQACIAESGGIIYVGLGMTTAGALLDTWFAYDIAAGTWSSVTNTNGPSARYGAVCVASGGALYVGLGEDAVGYEDDWYKYNISTNTWSTIADASGTPISARRNAVAVENSGIIYVGTGWNGNFLGTWAIYDIAGNAWSAMSNTDGPTARLRAAIGFAHGHVLCDAGLDATGYPVGTFAYDIAGDSWDTLATLTSRPSGRAGPAFAHGDGLLFIGGGSTSVGDIADWWKCAVSPDGASGTWTPLTAVDAPSVRWGGSAMYYDGKVYAGLGVAGTDYLNDWKIYDGDNDAFVYSPPAGKLALIHHLVLHNTDSVARTAELSLSVAGTEHQFMSVAIEAGKSVVVPFRKEGLILDDTSSILGTASAKDKITCTLCGSIKE